MLYLMVKKLHAESWPRLGCTRNVLQEYCLCKTQSIRLAYRIELKRKLPWNEEQETPEREKIKLKKK